MKQIAHAVTTVGARQSDGTLAATLSSLLRAGFGAPDVRRDGPPDASPTSQEHEPVRKRGPFAHWVLTLADLVLTRPAADGYLIFQDDVEVVSGLGDYLLATTCDGRDDDRYYNLCLYPSNHDYLKRCAATVDMKVLPGWHVSNQFGRGAQALLFPRKAARRVLGCPLLYHHSDQGEKGTRNIDGAVSSVARTMGLTEWVHYPSLVKHTGVHRSTIRDREMPETAAWEPDLDARSLIRA